MPKSDSIQNLQQILMDGGERVFGTAPKVILNIIKSRAWKKRLDENGKPFASFEALVSAPYWHGLESSVEDIRRICFKNEEALQAIDRIIPAAAEPGRELEAPRDDKGRYLSNGDNVTSGEEERGNSPTYALRRLKRDRPDLAERVMSGELSANAAAIEAGFRKPPKPRLKVCPHCGGEL